MQTWIPDFQIPLSGLKLATLWTSKANLRTLGEAGGTWDSLGDNKPLLNPSYNYIVAKHAHTKNSPPITTKKTKQLLPILCSRSKSRHGKGSILLIAGSTKFGVSQDIWQLSRSSGNCTFSGNFLGEECLKEISWHGNREKHIKGWSKVNLFRETGINKTSKHLKGQLGTPVSGTSVCDAFVCFSLLI